MTEGTTSTREQRYLDIASGLGPGLGHYIADNTLTEQSERLDDQIVHTLVERGSDDVEIIEFVFYWELPFGSQRGISWTSERIRHWREQLETGVGP